MSVRPILWLAPLLILAACGTRGELMQKPGASPPPRPIAAKTDPTPEQLMKQSDQARPSRNDELLRDSERRTPDRFDLPPPG